MTYRELRSIMYRMTEEQLDLVATLELDGIFFNVDDIYLYPEEGMELPTNYPFIRGTEEDV